MISVVEAVKTGAGKLKDCGIDNPEYDSFALLSEITGITRTDYLVRGNHEVAPQHYEAFMEFIERRCKHEPLQHILGKAWFYGREYVVNKDVLVPRADTEILVEQALNVLADGADVLDMCTGSGCIIITLALERKLKRAVGVDVSQAALNVAEVNVRKLEASVELVKSDLFTELSSGEKNMQFDMIVSNPPYIESAVIETLSDEVKMFDPIMALDGYEDGLHFYRSISESAKDFLKKNGWLIYEIGYNQAEAVSEIMSASGFTDIKVIKDYAGHDRVVMGKMI